MWVSDLAFGKKYEKIAIGLLENGEVEEAPEGVAFSDWDFKHDGVAYEVKSDRHTTRTGNLCIEYEHTNKPSGISITKADYWFYFAVAGDTYTVYKIPVGVLKDACSRAGVRTWHTDGGNSRFYLIPVCEFSGYKLVST